MADTFRVATGQVWADLDPRHPGRRVEVVEVGDTHATVALVSPRTWPSRSASLDPDDPRRAEAGRETPVRLDAFHTPGGPVRRSGYRFVRLIEPCEDCGGKPCPECRVCVWCSGDGHVEQCSREGDEYETA